MKNINFFRLSLILPTILICVQVKSAERYIEQTICFEDRVTGSGVVVDHDANDICISSKIIYDTNWPLQAGGSGMGPITVLMTPISMGGIDNFELILNSNLPTSGYAAYSLHYENAYSVISPGGTLYQKSEFFSCGGGGFVNVGTGVDCDGNPRAVTLEEGHGLSDGFTLADVLALKNISQGSTIISKSTVGSNVWVFPGLAAPVKEYQATWYDAYDVKSVSTSGDCDPSSANFSTCTSSDLNAIASHMASVVRASLNTSLVNVNPPNAKEFSIAQASSTTGSVSSGGDVVFSGSAWGITSASVSIGSYFAETIADGSGGTFQDFNIYKRRPICKIIACSGGTPPSGGGCAAPGNAPCDYSFCYCHDTQAGCDTGDPNGDNTCYWTGTQCKSAPDLTNQTDCQNAGFYWNYETSIGAYQCVGGNGSAHTCNKPLNDCTYMGNMTGPGSCSSTHVQFGSITVDSYTGTIGTSSTTFAGTVGKPTYSAGPSGELPDYANCSSNSQCQSGNCDLSSTYKCLP